MFGDHIDSCLTNRYDRQEAVDIGNGADTGGTINVERDRIMAVSSAPIVRFGELLGAASRESSAAFNRLLENAGMPFDEWVVYVVLERNGGVMPLDDLVSDVAGRTRIEREEVASRVDALLGQGLLASTNAGGASLVEFAAEGTRIYRALAEQVDRFGTESLSTSTPEEIDIARRVLAKYAEQAALINNR